MNLCLSYNINTKLNATEILVIELIADMCRRQGLKSPRGAAYCFPGQEWIAERIGKSREWVSTCVTRLAALGYLTVTRRRKIRGRWQTNLYRLGIKLLAILKDAKSLIKNLFSPCEVKFTHSLNTQYIDKANSLKKDFAFNNKSPGLDDIINRMSKKIGSEV